MTSRERTIRYHQYCGFELTSMILVMITVYTDISTVLITSTSMHTVVTNTISVDCRLTNLWFSPRYHDLETRSGRVRPEFDFLSELFLQFLQQHTCIPVRSIISVNYWC